VSISAGGLGGGGVQFCGSGGIELKRESSSSLPSVGKANFQIVVGGERERG